ncbi:nucleotide pyrophosphohydrolase [Salipaludibacillus sp. LMS25]|uniref:nucleotide pyrophosphohydrolase n=1 Tax=Salipaludibacillus sp. LMS25 TaxID=2924031 RepID=UPI0020CFF87E|nr:nucleotide pyrophosphohydrolase [Salipaludibacillus sp. LMS25]UTR14654.1 nucleotide pyrophosphohydrolase [Salipaludibacillus sp. LMS25]
MERNVMYNMAEKSMADMQQEVHAYISQFKEGYFSPLAMMARLTEEMGELAREINHFYGEKPKKQSEEAKTMEQEIGDVLFVMICLANSLDINLEESFRLVMTKFQNRDKDRWTKIDESEETT